MSKQKVSRGAGAEAPAGQNADIVLDAVALRRARSGHQAETDADIEREWFAEYAAILLRSDAPRPEDAGNLASCMETLKISVDQVRLDLAAVQRYREQLAVQSQVPEANRALDAAVAHRKAVEERRKTDLADALADERKARSLMHEANSAVRAMELLEETNPRLATAFASLRGEE